MSGAAESEWECGSCGAITDPTVADPGDLFHHIDDDCRAVRLFTPVECLYPSRDDYPDRDFPPGDWDEWAPEGGHCAHEHCIQGHHYANLFRSSGTSLSRAERDEMNADRELMLDEFHGGTL